MNCPACPRPGRPCHGERLAHLCGRPDYRDYLRDADPPGLATMAGSLASALAAHVIDGLHPASIEVVAAREATCRACPFHDASGDSCAICGCSLSIKRSWLSAHCPEGRWEATTPAESPPGARP